MALGGLTADFLIGRFLDQLPAYWQNPSTWLSSPPPLDLTLNQITSLTAGSITAVFLWGIGFWLVATVGEAGLITAVSHLHRHQPITWQQALQKGYHLLGRFVAIDTVVFFPWFVVALTAALVIIGMLLGTGFLAYQQSSIQAVAGLNLAGLACLVPLLCLLAPVGYLTLVFRTLAFRDSAVLQMGVRASIRHTWHLIRRRLGDVLMVTLAVWGADLLFGLLFNLIVWPITAVSAYFSLAFLPSLLDLLLILPQVIWQTLIATFWTVAFLEIMNYE